MATKVQTCHIAACDACGTEYEHDYTPHFPSAGEAIDEAVDLAEWWSDGATLLCRDCKEEPHAFVKGTPYPDDCDRCSNPADEHPAVAT